MTLHALILKRKKKIILVIRLYQPETITGIRDTFSDILVVKIRIGTIL